MSYLSTLLYSLSDSSLSAEHAMSMFQHTFLSFSSSKVIFRPSLSILYLIFPASHFCSLLSSPSLFDLTKKCPSKPYLTLLVFYFSTVELFFCHTHWISFSWHQQTLISDTTILAPLIKLFVSLVNFVAIFAEFHWNFCFLVHFAPSNLFKVMNNAVSFPCSIAFITLLKKKLILTSGYNQ